MDFIQWWHSVFDRSKEVTEPHYNLMKEAHETGWLEGREECAKLCEELSETYGDNSAGWALDIAADKMRSNGPHEGRPD